MGAGYGAGAKIFSVLYHRKVAKLPLPWSALLRWSAWFVILSWLIFPMNNGCLNTLVSLATVRPPLFVWNDTRWLALVTKLQAANPSAGFS